VASITRRDIASLFASAAAVRPVLAAQGQPLAQPPKQHWQTVPPREAIRQRYFPNVALKTQDDRTVHLYDDLIKDKIMIINFMYATCDRICPRVIQNLVKVQKLIGARAGRDVFFYSFTLDPLHDTPSALKEYAAVHGAGPGWTFLTGPPDRMEMLRRKLGFTDPDPAADKDRENHIGNIRYGNEARLLWGACPGMSHPEFIVESLSWVDWPATPRSLPVPTNAG